MIFCLNDWQVPLRLWHQWHGMKWPHSQARHFHHFWWVSKSQWPVYLAELSMQLVDSNQKLNPNQNTYSIMNSLPPKTSKSPNHSPTIPKHQNLSSTRLQRCRRVLPSQPLPMAPIAARWLADPWRAAEHRRRPWRRWRRSSCLDRRNRKPMENHGKIWCFRSEISNFP